MTNETIPVPCGKCPECIKRRTSAWSFRLMQEDKAAWCSHFVTLTYDTQTVPITRNGFMSLNKRDVQLFFKRLRKAHQGVADLPSGAIKYYLAGEYGEDNNRPHYHIILFNAKIELIQPAWGNGYIHYGDVSGASVGYTLKYLAKTKRIPMHRNDDRIQEFGLMSKGLGINYMTPSMMKWHLKDIDNRIHCTLDDGRKISMPRYYKDKLFSDLYFESAEQAMHIRKRVCNYQRQELIKQQLEEMEKQGDMYWYNKAEKTKEAFRKQEKTSTEGRWI